MSDNQGSQRMSVAQVATLLEGHADEYRISAKQEAKKPKRDAVSRAAEGIYEAKADALSFAAQLVRKHLA